MNFIKKTALIFALGLAIISCDRDDQVGQSQMTPTNPTISFADDFPTAPIVEGDQEYTFTVTLDKTNIIDTKLYVTQVGGNADADDYEVTGLITIPAGYTTGSGTLKILEDDLLEDTETLTLQIGDSRTSNSTITPATATITIKNVTSDDLVIDMSWEASELTTDSSGEEISATTLADMILSVRDLNGNILVQEDGGSFETLVFLGTYPDGEYLVTGSFYAVENFDRTLDLNVEFNQQGTINNVSYDFNNALHLSVCPENYFVLAKFTKTGASYTTEPVGTANVPAVVAGVYDVVSNGTNTDGQPAAVDLPYTVTIEDNGDGTYTITDGVAGVYIFWYSIYGYTFETEGSFSQTPCNGLNGSWEDAFGGTITLTGSSNADGTLSIHWTNSFGDVVDAVYTPQ